ncbi:fungal specific transcription factor domain-containing protein [Lacticaseibacillus rhamnosus]
MAIETIEACLIFLQRHNTIHRAPTLPGLWGDIGTVVGMAHDLGLNVNPSAWCLSPSDENRRLRIWWALYIQDKCSALGLGRGGHVGPVLRDRRRAGDVEPTCRRVEHDVGRIGLEQGGG